MNIYLAGFGVQLKLPCSQKAAHDLLWYTATASWDIPVERGIFVMVAAKGLFSRGFSLEVTNLDKNFVNI